MNPERDTLYLDANATTPVLPAALAAMNEAAAGLYGNPSSTHTTGLRARQLMDDVRQRAARLLDTGAGQLVFVSGATEAIQTAVLSALCDLRARRDAGQDIPPLLLVGATVGGYVGGALGQRLPAKFLRLLVISVGSGMTLYYFWATYFAQ